MAAVVTPIVSTFVPKGVIDAEKAFAKLGKQLQSAIGTAAMLSFGKAAISAAEDAEKSAARIRNIAKQMGYTAGQTEKLTARLLDYAAATAKATGVDDDQIAAIQAKLLTFRSLAETAGRLGDVFDRTTQAAIDLAAAGFGDAESNALLLAKALENPLKGLSKLERAIGPLTEAQRKNIETLIQQNDLYGAQQAILKIVEGKVGGTAAATATATDKLKVTFDQLAETVGQAILPAFTKLVDLFAGAVELFGKLPQGLQDFIIIGLALVVVLKKVRQAIIAMKVAAESANLVIAALAVAAEIYFAIVGDGAEEAKSSIEQTAELMLGMSDANVLAADSAGQLFAQINDISRKDYFKTLVAGSIESARRLLDLYIAAGYPQDAINDLALAIYDYELASSTAADNTAKYSDANYKAVEPTKSLWDSVKDLTDGIKEQYDAYKDALKAKLAFFSSDLAAAAAQRDVASSLADYNELMASLADGTYRGRDAMLDVAQAQDDFYQATLDSAQAQADLAIAQGDTRSATEIQIAELERVRDSLDPNSPLRQQLNAYIASLKLIPTSLTTKIRADITAALTGFTFNKFTLGGETERRAGGGPVYANQPYIVGDGGGPELFVPKDSGSIIPTSRLATLGTSGAQSGNVYNITVTGAVDPAGTARTIKNLLQDDGKRRNQIPVPT